MRRIDNILLDAKAVSFYYDTDRKKTLRVKDVSLTIHENEIVGLIGESGSGKSTLGKLFSLQLKPTSGSIEVFGKNREEYGKRELRECRRTIQVIFQDAAGALNPRLPIWTSIEEPLLWTKSVEKKERRDRVKETMVRVGLSTELLERYPHQLSGGQKQRVNIARALIGGTKLVICDEMVSALDVSVQASILNLMRDIQEERKLSLLFISHDINVVSIFTDRVAVMKNGHIVEMGPTRSVLKEPKHPYTNMLINLRPNIARRRQRKAELFTSRTTLDESETWDTTENLGTSEIRDYGGGHWARAS